MSEKIKWQGIGRHTPDLESITRLLIDLRKQQEGLEFEPITKERLDRCSKAVFALSRCGMTPVLK